MSDAKSDRELREWNYPSILDTVKGNRQTECRFCLAWTGHDKITFERMSKLARERPWSKQTTSSSTRTSSPVLPILPAPVNKDAEGSAEPLVWVHQTELFEKASGAKSKKPPYEGVLDWYPDVSRLLLLPLGTALSNSLSFLSW